MCLPVMNLELFYGTSFRIPIIIQLQIGHIISCCLSISTSVHLSHIGSLTRELKSTDLKKQNQKIWGKTRCESTRCCKSEWRENFPSSSHVAWTQMHQHTQNAHCRLSVVNISRVISGISRPSSIFSVRERRQLIMPFTACRYLYPLQRYLQSKSKFVINSTKIWKFFAPLKIVPTL